MRKRMLCIGLAVLLVCGTLTGCGKDTSSDSQSSADAQAGAESATASQYAYQAQYYDLPEQINWIGTSCVSEQTMYFSASVPSGRMESYTGSDGEEYSYELYLEQLFALDLNTGACEQLENYSPEPEQTPLEAQDMTGYNANTNIQKLAAGQNGTIWLFRQTSWYSAEGTDNYALGELLQLDAHGTTLRTITVEQDTRNDDGEEFYYTYVDDLFTDDKGYVYTYDYQTLNIYGADGTRCVSLDAAQIDGTVCQLSEGEVGVVGSSADGTRVFRPYDPVTQSFGSETPINASAWNVFPGNDVYRYFYLNSNNIFGERQDTGETEKVLDWLACDIDSNNLSGDSYAFLDDGRIVAIIYDYTSSEVGNQQQVIVLNRVDAATVQQKTELTLACFSLDYNLRSQIVRFNRTNASYRIVVTDYAEYSTDDDYYAGLTKLNTEILAGKVPDLFANGLMMPMRQYAAKGLLEDLWTYIDADPEYTRDSFVQGPLLAAQTDDKLYQLPLDFTVATAVGLGKVVGDYDTWTLAELTDALGKLPQGAMVFDRYTTQESVLQYCVMLNAENFIDWQTGTCNFESDAFQALLEFVKLFPAEYEYNDEEYESDFSRMKNGKQLLYLTEVSGFEDTYNTFAALDNDICFVGFPSEDGKSGNTFSTSVSLSISSTCKDKTGAWSFLRSTLSQEYQDDLWSFPIVQSVFDSKAAKAMEQEYELDENGNQVLDENGQPIPVSHGGMSWGNEDIIELYAVTQEQYDTIMGLIEKTTRFADYDTNIMTIISEEAAGFLAGDKTVEETARLIQSRANLYLQEQK